MSQAASRRGGPTRRSTRISQSAASRSVVSAETGASATPGKLKGSLPKLKSRQSTAYGASGRVGDAEELQVPVTGFTQAFQVQRDAAMAREEPPMRGAEDNDDDDDDGHSPTPVPNGAEAPTSQDYESENPFSDGDDEQPEDFPTEDSSVANTSKSFGMVRESGMLRGPTAYLPPAQRARRPVPAPVPLPASTPASRRTEPRSVPSQTRTQFNPPVRPQNTPRFMPPPPLPRTFAQPPTAQARVPIATQPIYTTKSDKPWYRHPWLSYLAFALVALMLAMFIPNTEFYQSTAKSFKSYIHEKTWEPPLRYPDKTLRLMYDWMRTQDNTHTKELADMNTTVSAQRETLSRLEQRLPPLLTVTRQPDGSNKIEDGFWRLLQGRMKQEGFHGSSDVDWDKFFKDNQDKLSAIWSKSFDASKPHPYAVRREEVIKLLDDNWTKMSTHVDKKIAEVVKSIDKEVKKAVTKEAKQAYLDQIRLQSLAMTNLVSNMELSLKKVNYFSRGLGATIDPDITSPTQVEKLAWFSRTLKRLLVAPERQPPTAAIEKWDEAGDCWCTASDGGKAQLGVYLPTAIFPDQITIEHIPMASVPGKNVANAPKTVELWVKSDQPIIPRFGSFDGCKDKGPKGFVCLGSVQYDIFGANHIQTFDLPARSQVSIDHAIVRIPDNWGADHTCLYRVRLHGAYDGPEHNYGTAE